MGFKKGKLNIKYKDGITKQKYYCIDCGKKLSNYRAIRCQSCENKIRFTGIKLSKKHKKKISIALKKVKPKKKNYCKDCGKEIDYRSKRCTKCAGTLRKGKNLPKCIDCNKEISYDAIRCTSCRQKGELNHFYIDGRTDLKKAIRNLDEYNQWRKSCYYRDNYICQECYKIGYQLEAHHKKSFAKLLTEFLKEYNQFSPIEDKETLIGLAIKWKSFWDIDNGITLCKKCHLIIEPRNIKELIET